MCDELLNERASLAVGRVRPILAKSVDGTSAMIVDGPTIVATDIACTNDVIHVIGRVLMV
ncbi:hypothetical protein ASE75_14365 [Sphingomonas sp. Leaf17]|uniref:fasciclin domain-containing protein n=1 Tax=Sphingomonas sp. Leaf17 TaxID=1735683 RepID=UPI0006FFE8A9|nr:hypothetical protein ASE75_14365 [Sphingomonas sp. Leaf17]